MLIDITPQQEAAIRKRIQALVDEANAIVLRYQAVINELEQLLPPAPAAAQTGVAHEVVPPAVAGAAVAERLSPPAGE